MCLLFDYTKKIIVVFVDQYSSSSSSPVAPKTPSTVDIQHNGKTYTIQVQVLGTEETWQTPSLVLATVKDGKGKAVFSQVRRMALISL